MEAQSTGEKRPYQPPQIDDALAPFLQWQHPSCPDVRPVTQCKFKLISGSDKGCIAAIVTCYVSAASLKEIGLSADAVANEMRGTLVPQMEKRLSVRFATGFSCPAHIGLLVYVDGTTASSIAEASCDD